MLQNPLWIVIISHSSQGRTRLRFWGCAADDADTACLTAVMDAYSEIEEGSLSAVAMPLSEMAAMVNTLKSEAAKQGVGSVLALN